MLLVDTSVWIEVFAKARPLDLESVTSLDEIVTCPPVVQEVLQGFRDERAFQLARRAITAFPMVDAPMELAVFESAAGLYRLARRGGLTIRSATDCLIAASALRHGLTVLHRDRDFGALAKVSALVERRIR